MQVVSFCWTYNLTSIRFVLMPNDNYLGSEEWAGLPDDYENPSHSSCEQCSGRVCLDAACDCDWDKATERAEGPVHVSDALCNAVCLANNVASIIRLAGRR